MKIIIYISFIIFCWINSAKAQYFPVFSHYVINGLVINPAYTGSREVMSINILYRNQMIGINGAPVYQTLSIHAPLKNPKLGLGFLFFNENTGPLHTTHAFATYAYKVQLGAGKLNFGLQTGIIYGEYNWNTMYLNDPGDQAFNSNNNTYVLPNIGAGLYYYSRSFFAGLAVPYFLSYKETGARDAYSIYHDLNNYNFLFSAGYLFRVSKDFKLKPSTLVKYYINSSEQIDLNLIAILLDDKLWIGGSYRFQEAVAALFELQINPQFRISYTFEYAGNNTGYFNYTSHEIGLRYEFSYKLKAFNPRYF